MLNWKVMAGVGLIWLAGLGLDALLFGGYFVTRSGEASTTIDYLFSPPPVVDLWDWVLRWLGLLTWDFTFLDGPWQIIRWIMLIISSAIMLGLAQTWLKIPFIGRS